MKSARLFPALMLAGILALPQPVSATYVVRMETVLGDVDIWLREDAAPGTVNNFLGYALRGDYIDTFIHRSEPGFVIQGGGFTWDDDLQETVEIPTQLPIRNEYDLPNVRGTIAMAKIGGNPDSATNQWFFNLADNTSTLGPANNGGYTVFGSVLGDGMDIIDDIAAIQRWNASSLNPNFDTLPLIDYVSGPLLKTHLALINNIRVLTFVPNTGTSIGTPVMGASGDYTVAQFMPDDTVNSLDAVDNPSPGDAPEGVSFPEGFFEFDLDNAAIETTVALHLPPGHTYNTYYKYGATPENSTPHWYEFRWDGQTGAKIYNDLNLIVLTFRDGERGDDDLSINSNIVDVGAPGIAPVTDDGGGGGGGAGGSGLLALLAAGWAWRRLGRGRRRE